MKDFAVLLEKLIFQPSRNRKIEALAEYFAQTPDPDRGYALAAITRDLNLKNLKAGALKTLTMERVDPVLFQLSYDYVGDMAETISLIWPDDRPGELPSISEFVDLVERTPKAKLAEIISDLLDMASPNERWAMIKMVAGGLRIGVSARLAKTALAHYAYNRCVISTKAVGRVERSHETEGDPSTSSASQNSLGMTQEKILQDIEKIWHGLDIPYTNLFAWLDGKAEKPEINHAVTFHPMMLSTPVDEDKDFDILVEDDYQAEWKWDGIRVQLVFDAENARLFSRTGDDISAGFPDVLDGLSGSGVLDGELLVGDDGQPMPFNCLQQRLNRKTVTKKHLTDYPAFIRVYDMLFDGNEDIRSLPLLERRGRLEKFFQTHKNSRLDLSEILNFETWKELEDIRIQGAEEHGHEGIMIKRKDSVYVAGRPRGPWFKWKRDPRTVDAILMYAQRGHGKRSSYYSDFTFGVWKGNEIVPIGKAYSGFTDEELKKLDKFVRSNTIERFGPVREVKKELVLEIAFDSAHESPRHKSGIALRFPRINRIRWDKPVQEVENLEAVKRALL